MIERLKSRKFLLTIAGIVLVTLFPEQADNFIILIGSFIGAEGLADTVGRYKGQSDVKTTVSQNDDIVDSSMIITGKTDPSNIPLFNEEEKPAN